MSAGVIASHYAEAASAGTYAAAVMADSPLAYWRCADAAGSVLLDSSGNGRNLTVAFPSNMTFGRPSLTHDAGDSAVRFDTAPASADMSNAAWQQVANITVEAVVSVSTLSGNLTIMERDGSSPSSIRAWRLTIVSGKPQFFAWNSTGTLVQPVAPSALALNTPTHVAATFDGTAARIYVGGSQVVSANLSGSLRPATTVLSVGSFFADNVSSRSDQFFGDMDEVAIYGAALSATRIAAHAAAM